jgi:hypothetical protein
MLQTHSEEGCIDLPPHHAPPRQEHPYSIDTEDDSCSEAELYQQWRVEGQQLEEHLRSSAYTAILPIISSVLSSLKRVASRHNILNWRRSDIYHVFLRTNILSNIVKAVVSADRDRCAAG